MLLGGSRGGEEQDVAAGPIARQTGGFCRNMVWALAHARGWGGGWITRGEWLGRGCWGFGRGGGGWRRRLGASGALWLFAAIASGLRAAVLFAAGGGAIALTGMPASPASCGALTGRA